MSDGASRGRGSMRVMNLAHLVEQNVRRFADRPAFVWGDRVWSWRDLDARITRMAGVLAANGLRRGDRLLVQSRNCNQMFESMFAAFRLGAVWVPANFRGMPDDLASMAQVCGAKVLLCDAGFPEHAAIDVPTLMARIAIGSAEFGPDIDALMADPDCALPDLAPVDRDDPAWLFFTSGTTGRPKAAVLTHGQLAFVITNHLADLVPGANAHDAALVVAPLSHGAGMHQLMMTARGAPAILPGGYGFDPAAVWDMVTRWRITNMFTVPTILKALVEAPERRAHDHSSLRHVIYAGAPMYRTDQVAALDALGPVLVQYYGLGEVTGAITVLPAGEHAGGDDLRIGTCGYPRTAMQVEIQDAEGTPLGPGNTGEICVIGPAVFAGYWNNPGATAATFRKGWFRTGDLGHMDKAGYLYITGRQSDMYISGGSNIAPREIEEKILQYPGIAEVAVFGMPDPVWGEHGVAICVPRPGCTLDAEALTAFLRARLASYKLPRELHFWDSLPRTGYGKLSKRVIRAELEARRERDTPVRQMET